MIYCKKRKLAFLVCSVLVCGIFLVFEFFPQSAHIKENNRVTFSKESGFYDEEFMLELSALEGEIYYTLDGSIPDRTSKRYEEPILIYDATENENVHSMRTDVSTGFEVEEIERVGSETPPGYQVPNYKVDKATIIRAVAYDKLGEKSEVASASYFVGFSEKEVYDGMNVLSIVTEPDNLFDYENGIYVTGKAYDEYKEKYRYTEQWYFTEEYHLSWGANYQNRGMKWERDASCLFFDEQGRLKLEQECGIRIHGGDSRGLTPKSLNIYARKEYDGNKMLQADLFETGYYPAAVTLFQGGNEYRTRAKDFLIASEIKDMNIGSMNFEPYVLFLNGEYWGVYWLNEKYDKNYLEYYYDVKPDNVIIIKSGGLEEGEEEDFKYYQEMLDYCSKSDLTQNAEFEKVCEMIDINSYVDYYAVMLFSARCVDWPEYNFILWRTKKTEGGIYGDGKWRWMVFDMNSEGFDADFDSVEHVMKNDAMFNNMMSNKMFRKMLFERIEEVMEIYDYEKMKLRVEEYRNFILEKVRQHDKRFFGDDSADIFNAEMDAIDEFFKNRGAYMQFILEKYR